MAVKIRLQRVGGKKKPFFRVVVTDSRNSRGGKSIDILGYYNPAAKPTEVKVDSEKIKKWILNGAVMTETTKHLLKKEGVLKELAVQKAG